MFLQDKDVLLPPNPKGAEGPKVGFMAAFDAAFDDQSLNASMAGAEMRFRELFESNVDLVNELTGERINPRIQRPFSVLGIVGDEDLNPEVRKQDIEAHTEINNKFKELKKQYPQIKTFEDMLADIRKEAVSKEKRAQSVSAREGTAGWWGDLFGRISGSFTTGDPVNIVTLGFGGGGRHVATRILSEAGANSAIETINQFSGVPENREILDLQQFSNRDKINNIMFAGAGAGILRGGFEGVAAGINRLNAKSAAGKAITDNDIADALNDLPENTATKRAASMLLEQEAAMREATPFRKKRSAEAVHQVLYRRAYNELNEPWDPTANVGSRADREFTAQALRARGIDPDLTARDALQELERVGTPRNIDEARLFAQRELEPAFREELIAEASNKLAKGEVKQLQKELRDLEKKIADLDKDFKVTAKRANQKKGVTRKQAEKQARQATDADRQTLEAQRQRVTGQLDAHARAAQAEADLTRIDNGQIPNRYQAPIEGRANELQAMAEAFARKEPVTPRGYSRLEAARSVDEVETKINDKLDEITDQQFQTAARGLDDDGGKVDIGLETEIDPNMKIKLVDDEGNVKGEISVRDALKDIADDDALVRAVKECGI